MVFPATGLIGASGFADASSPAFAAATAAAAAASDAATAAGAAAAAAATATAGGGFPGVGATADLVAAATAANEVLLPMGATGLALPLVVYAMTMTSLRLGFGAAGVAAAQSPDIRGTALGGLVLSTWGTRAVGKETRRGLCAMQCDAQAMCVSALGWGWDMVSWRHCLARRHLSSPQCFFACKPFMPSTPWPSPAPSCPNPAPLYYPFCPHPPRRRLPALPAPAAVPAHHRQPVPQVPDGARRAAALGRQRRLHTGAAGGGGPQAGEREGGSGWGRSGRVGGGGILRVGFPVQGGRHEGSGL